MTRVARTRVTSVGLLLLVLAAGFSMGMAWDQTVLAAATEITPEPAEEEERGYVIYQVGLNPQQQEEVERIIEHYHAQLKALNDEFQQVYEPRRDSVGGEARKSIHEVLDEQQSVQYDSLLEVRRLKREAEGNEDSEDGDW